jgi:hypothetical protein
LQAASHHQHLSPGVPDQMAPHRRHCIVRAGIVAVVDVASMVFRAAGVVGPGRFASSGGRVIVATFDDDAGEPINLGDRDSGAAPDLDGAEFATSDQVVDTGTADAESECCFCGRRCATVYSINRLSGGTSKDVRHDLSSPGWLQRGERSGLEDHPISIS